MSIDRLLAPTGRPWPRGYRNNNPGNIDYHPGTPWQGLADQPLEPAPRDGSRRRFAVFASPAWGLRALFRVLITYRDRKATNGTPVDTIEEIITRWAPAIENKTVAYISAVDKAHPADADDILDVRIYEDAMPLARAIVRHELGDPRAFGLADWYDDATWDRAADLAGLKRRKARSVAAPEIAGPTVAAGAGAAVAAVEVAPLVTGVAEAKDLVEPGSAAAKLLVVLIVGVALWQLRAAWKRRKVEAQ